LDMMPGGGFSAGTKVGNEVVAGVAMLVAGSDGAEKVAAEAKELWRAKWIQVGRCAVN
jgi:hypothetical protein